MPVRFLVLNSQALKILPLVLLLAAGPTFGAPVLSPLFSNTPKTNARGVMDELDPDDTPQCSSLGELNIEFRTENSGPPNVGIVLTDPRGRRLGFDPLTKEAWQELPVAQGYIDCDGLGGADTCRGVVQVCGPVSGSYTLELIAEKTTAYSVSVSARSRKTSDGHRFQFTRSDANVSRVAIPSGSRDIVLVNYWRDPGEKVAAELPLSQHAQR